MAERDVAYGATTWEPQAAEDDSAVAGTWSLVWAHVRAWGGPLLIALVLALLIRGFVLQAFRIPTESMEQNLLVGDYVLVSKLHYGPRLPVTLGIPFTEWYWHGVELPVLRLPGFTDVQRGDVIVFNYPAEPGPIDQRTHYIKRVVGGPGDVVAIRNKVVHVNGVPQPLAAGMQQRWLAHTRPGAVMPLDRIRDLGVRRMTSAGHAHSRIAFEGTVAMAREVESWNEVKRVEPYITRRDPSHGLRIFPRGSGYGRDQYGPVYVPAAGDTLTLTGATWPLYRDVIMRFEGHTARRLGENRFEIDGVQTARYVVEQDYYFVMGDNRDDSADSRVWGFVPMSHIVGKAFLTYFSWDPLKQAPRLDRIFKRVR